MSVRLVFYPSVLHFDWWIWLIGLTYINIRLSVYRVSSQKRETCFLFYFKALTESLQRQAQGIALKTCIHDILYAAALIKDM
jgi:hypothetical protein